MRLRHSTPSRNLGSIGERGLLVSKSRGKLPAVWLHSPGRSAWAVLHVSRRHKVRVEETATVEVEIPRSWLKKSGRPGLWYCPLDVLPDRFGRTITFDELSASPVESHG
ncbi:MAG: hypothetical protein U0797_00475 [Gemmataceae bacterium]